MKKLTKIAAIMLLLMIIMQQICYATEDISGLYEYLYIGSEGIDRNVDIYNSREG